MLLWLALSSVQPGCGLGEGCLHRNLGDWCFHLESLEGPAVGEPDMECAPAELRVGTELPAGTLQCGGYLVVSEGGGFTGVVHYFDLASEEHASTRYWTDYNHYCGGFDFWYGKRVDCEVECVYGGEDGGSLPACG